MGAAEAGAAAEAVFDAYVGAGGNLIDTADVYAGGGGETMLGEMIAERGARDQLVLATKSGFAAGRGPSAGGNGAKPIHAALEGSLARLKTDYIDLYWVHVWDSVTPPEELLETMSGLVRSGKIRYWGMSNTPAWYVARIVTLAAAQGRPGPIALQYFYSLVSREVEAEHVPLALDTGLGVMPWSPLAYGLLTGKYDRAAVEAAPSRAGGLADQATTGAGERVAAEIDEPPARVALAWALSRPAVDTVLVGVSRVSQLEDNIKAVALDLSSSHLAALDAASRPDLPMLYGLFSDEMRRQVVYGGAAVSARR